MAIKVIGSSRDAPPVRVERGTLTPAGLKGAKPPKPVTATGVKR